MNLRSAERPGLALLLLSLASFLHCRANTIPNSPGPPGPTAPVIPSLDLVVLVVLENQSYPAIVDNPAMPFLNGLASDYGLASNYFANIHPSLPNYFMLTTGETLATDNDFVGPVTEDNLVRRFVASGKTWKCYAESLPSV